MHCANCGKILPQGANACPDCGTLSSSLGTGSHSAADSPTIINPAASSQAAKPTEGEAGIYSLPTRSETPQADIPPQKPATYYGSQPSYVSEPNPYAGSASNPYGSSYAASSYSTDTPPPPPSTRKRNKRTTTLVVVLCLVLLVLVGTGVLVFVVRPGSQKAGAGQGTATQQSQGSATPTSQPISPSAQQTLYDQTTATTPVINDSLSGPDSFGWDNYTGNSGQTRCFFSQSAYHSIAQPGYFSPCYTKASNYHDFVLQVKMTIVSGHSGGLVFRADSTDDKGYQFRISTDGTYILNRIILNQQGQIQSDGETVVSGSSALVQQGTNQLAVIAQGNTITLFINGKYVDGATDNTYQSGQVGIYVDSDASSVEGAFTNLQVWKLT